eukprot:jgi/Chrzof1/12194/Cz06g24200.t1
MGLRMPALNPLATARLVLLAWVLYCWEARAQQLLPVPDHAFFAHNFARDGPFGPLGTKEALATMTGALGKGWKFATVQLLATSLAHSAPFGRPQLWLQTCPRRALCICREASSNGRYCSAWLCMNEAPGLRLAGIADGQAFDTPAVMAAFINNGLQIKGCQCTKQARNGNFCVVWQCIKYNDDGARIIEAHERYVCDTAYHQSQGASGQVPPTAPWGDNTALKAAAPSVLLDQSSNSSTFCAAWTGWKESDRVHEEHKCTCQVPSASRGYCVMSLCNQRHQSVAVGYLPYFMWSFAAHVQGLGLMLIFYLSNKRAQSQQDNIERKPFLTWDGVAGQFLPHIPLAISIIATDYYFSAADAHHDAMWAHIGLVLVVYVPGYLLMACFYQGNQSVAA